MNFVELVQAIADESSSTGTLATNREHLARSIWKLAMGETKNVVKRGETQEVHVSPARWAAELVVSLLREQDSGNLDESTQALLKDVKKLLDAGRLNDELL